MSWPMSRITCPTQLLMSSSTTLQGCILQISPNHLWLKSGFHILSIASIMTWVECWCWQGKRSCLQAGYSCQKWIHNVGMTDQLLKEWTMRYRQFVPRWQDADASDILIVIQTCTCKNKSCTACKYAEAEISCLPFCTCHRSCDNI